MILSDVQIRELIEKENLISDYRSECIQTISYDLTSGASAQIFTRGQRRIDLRKHLHAEGITQKVSLCDGYDLMPGEYILIKTKESICLPRNILAHIRPRTTYNKLGLLLSSLNINPTFSGYLYLGLQNVSPNTITIYQGLRIAQIVFEQFDGAVTEMLLYMNNPASKYQNEDEFIPSAVSKDWPQEVRKRYDEILQELNGN